MLIQIEEHELDRLKWQFEDYKNKYNKLKKELGEVKDENYNLNCRIEQELEPRIKAEKASYDAWVLEDTGARACDCFSSLLDDLIEFVEDPDNEKYMDWEDSSGDLECKILYLIKNKEDDSILYIEEKD